jgi:hypothetical protein
MFSQLALSALKLPLLDHAKQDTIVQKHLQATQLILAQLERTPTTRVLLMLLVGRNTIGSPLYCLIRVLLDCVACPMANYCPIATTVPVPCGERYYSSQEGLSEQSQCAECPAGWYCQEAQTVEPIACPVGEHSAKLAAACTVGHFQSFDCYEVFDSAVFADLQ